MMLTRFLQKDECLRRLRLDSRVQYGAKFESLTWREKYDALIEWSSDTGTYFGSWWNGFSKRFSYGEQLAAISAHAATATKTNKHPFPWPSDGHKVRRQAVRAYVLEDMDKATQIAEREQAVDKMSALRQMQREFTENLKAQTPKEG